MTKIILVFLWLDYVLTEKCVVYKAMFLDKINDCDGFENKMLNAEGLNFATEEGDEDGEGSMTMQGQIKLGSAIEKGDAIQIEVWKETEIGQKEFVSSARWDICKNLQNTEAPWYPLLECLRISQCPVPADDYRIQDLSISLAGVKDVLRHEFCGSYTTELKIVNSNSIISEKSCHVIGLAIVEKEEEC